MAESGSIWMDGVRRPRFAPLAQDIEADFVVAGAGITGLTTALLLASHGPSVVVLEADRVGSGTTAASSAHVTAVPDEGYRGLLRRVGERNARALVERSAAALQLIADLAVDLSCDFLRVPAYLFSERQDDRGRLEDECAAAAQLGQRCSLTSAVPLPWSVESAVCFPDQVAFQPLRYLIGLSKQAVEQGVVLAESTPVIECSESHGRVHVRTPRAWVSARAFVLATHTPLGFNVVQAEVAPYRSYIIALELAQPLVPALCWDTSDPYFYIRHYDSAGTPIAVVGGADHKTGHETNALARFAVLEEFAAARFGRCTVRRRWSAQFYTPADGLPYIGRAPRAQQVYLATGFSGVGLVQGTMAAIELAAALRGQASTPAFAATRRAIGAVPRLLSENVDVAAHWLGDRLLSQGSLSDVAAGEGKIVRVDGKRRAVSRADDGTLHVLSPVCTHMGCIVHWNNAERSWDCPCHGARYAPTGEVLEGPAVSPLERYPVSSAKRTKRRDLRDAERARSR